VPAQAEPSEATSPVSFSVMSWNIDFQRPLENERMRAALDHLGSSSLRGGRSAIILFNEMVASDLQLIQETPWIQQGYYITDLTGEGWIHRYGKT